jgi:predicted metal-binding protein
LSLLAPAAEGPSLIVCNTCRFSAEAREDAKGVRGGARLVEALRQAQAGDARVAGLAVEEMPCLFNCTQHCSVHLRAPGKIGYVLGRFEPTADSAQALLAYAAAYIASEEGLVPYRQWPEGVKGHFIVRTRRGGRSSALSGAARNDSGHRQLKTGQLCLERRCSRSSLSSLRSSHGHDRP